MMNFMKMKLALLVVVFCAVFFSQGLYAQSSMQKVLLLPFHNDVDITVYSDVSADTTYDIIFQSLYGLIGTLPSIDVPQSEELASMEWTADDLGNLGTSEAADLIISGSFVYTGTTGSPEAVITVEAYDVDDGEIVYTREFTTDPTDVDIFDDMDIMALDIIEQVFLIRANIAYLRLESFMIANDLYSVYINNKLVTVASNVLFEYDQKLLSGINYNVMVERQRDNALVMNAFVMLEANDRTNLTYSASATAEIADIKNKDKKKEYVLLLDGEEVQEGDVISDLSTTMDHSLILLEKVMENQIIVARTNFSTLDGAYAKVGLKVPKAQTGSGEVKTLMIHVYGGQSSFGGIGVEWNIKPKIWLGLSSGYSFYWSEIVNNSIHSYSFNLEFGYRLINSSINLSLGTAAGVYLSTSFGNDSSYDLSQYFPSPWGLVITPFVQLDWKFIYLRAGAAIEPIPHTSFSFAPSIGIRF